LKAKFDIFRERFSEKGQRRCQSAFKEDEETGRTNFRLAGLELSGKIRVEVRPREASES
jgi:hypothetical protein